MVCAYPANGMDDGPAYKEWKNESEFNEFGLYSKRKQANKLRSIGMSIQDGSMSLSSYTIIHTDARLSVEDKKTITDWVSNIKDSLFKN
jgi:hypothetical protein